MKGRYDETRDVCLKEMFKRVGEEYPNPELTDQEDWYTQRTWTKAEEDDFGVWMKKHLKKKHRYWTKRTIDLEVGMFLLMWGWKTDTFEEV